ncbi:MAG: cobalamin biosynthesis protein, partial [Eubacteriales bacterium]|nr:cobalamin biosynthesis protein [Eubacteriales bacterium]
MCKYYYYYLTQEAEALARKIHQEFGGELSGWPVRQHDFLTADALIMIMATGIAVRTVAPWLRSKTSDPAVIVLDQQGQFVIPLLGGHIGGANNLSLKIARFLGGKAVITTATDVRGLPAWDSWAYENGLVGASADDYKHLAAGMLGGIPVRLAIDENLFSYNRWTTGRNSAFSVNELASNDLAQAQQAWQQYLQSTMTESDTPEKEINILISILDTEQLHKQTCPNHMRQKLTVHLHPPVLWLGIGCRKNIEAERLVEAAERFLLANNISKLALAGLATISLKAEEPAIRRLADLWQLPVEVYETSQLAELARTIPGSEFVRQQTGIPAVAEPAACKAAGTDRALIAKSKYPGITLALAGSKTEIRLPDTSGSR